MRQSQSASSSARTPTSPRKKARCVRRCSERPWRPCEAHTPRRRHHRNMGKGGNSKAAAPAAQTEKEVSYLGEVAGRGQSPVSKTPRGTVLTADPWWGEEATASVDARTTTMGGLEAALVREIAAGRSAAGDGTKQTNRKNAIWPGVGGAAVWIDTIETRPPPEPDPPLDRFALRIRRC